MSRPRGLFVTGTDTGVGKTLIGVGLIRLAHRAGLSPVPYKPVETGCAPDPLDALALWRAAGAPIRPDEVCPHALRLPAAPAVAAAAESVTIDPDDLVRRARTLAARGDFLLVEGAGGLLVPYAGNTTAAELAAAIGLPLLLVARTALGTINHTSLTLREAARAGLPVAGVVLNRTSPETAPHEPTNAEWIARLTGVQPLGTMPYLPDATRLDVDLVADALAKALGSAGTSRLLGTNL